ncbi:MAG TPA: tetratricopeptide repeat protein [Gammaproteobacteria bacterium]|jgi:tetratricopeptide (TPR) repeat protein|nr:tetratricopeptide repeat protein [Gammaproteobacteria bacterium]
MKVENVGGLSQAFLDEAPEKIKEIVQFVLKPNNKIPVDKLRAMANFLSANLKVVWLYPDALVALGLVYEKLGDTKLAHETYQMARQRHPEQQEAYFRAAALCLEEKRYMNCREILNRLKKYVPAAGTSPRYNALMQSAEEGIKKFSDAKTASEAPLAFVHEYDVLLRAMENGGAINPASLFGNLAGLNLAKAGLFGAAKQPGQDNRRLRPVKQR